MPVPFARAVHAMPLHGLRIQAENLTRRGGFGLRAEHGVSRAERVYARNGWREPCAARREAGGARTGNWGSVWFAEHGVSRAEQTLDVGAWSARPIANLRHSFLARLGIEGIPTAGIPNRGFNSTPLNMIVR